MLEIRNKFGFPQEVDEDNEHICSGCSVGYTNHGKGTLCPGCREINLQECELLYAESYL